MKALKRLRDDQRGVSLIEVLVAMVVLSFGIISFAGLQTVSIKYGKMAQYRTVAAQLASDFADRTRANSVFAAAGNYDYIQNYAALGAPIVVPGCATPICTPTEMRDIDLAQWRNIARVALPGGSLFAQQDATVVGGAGVIGAAEAPTVVDLWVLWVDPATDEEAALGQNCPPAIGNAVGGPQCMHFRITL
ncbi:MAG: type IV pilus modification protein PilV [Burkholderiaceae bacterium]